MIQTITQYLISCDVLECSKRSGARSNANALHDELISTGGWESREVEDPNGPEVLFPISIYRCPKCVKAGKYPTRWDEGWSTEVPGNGDQK